MIAASVLVGCEIWTRYYQSLSQNQLIISNFFKKIRYGCWYLELGADTQRYLFYGTLLSM